MIRKKIELFIFGFYDHPNVMQTGVINSSRIWWPTFWRNICFFLVSSSCGSDCNFSSFTLFFLCIYLYVTRFIWTQTQHDSSLFVTLFLSWVHSAGSGKGTKQASACSILQRLKQRHRLQVKAKWMDEHPSTKLLRTDLFLHMTLSCKITKIEFGPLKFSGPHIEYDFFFKKVTGECPSTP